MKIEILDATEEHIGFITKYSVDYISDGLLFDLTPEKRALLRSKMIQKIKYCNKKIAVNADNPKEFLGFIVYEDNVMPLVHILYVKKKFQNAKIGTTLLAEAVRNNEPIIVVPFKSPSFHGFLKKLNIKPLVRFYEFLRS